MHSSGANFHTNGALGNNRNSESCILLLISIKTNSTKEAAVTVFWNSRATISLITFIAVEALGLIENEVQITVTKRDGKQKSMASKSCLPPLMDVERKIVEFNVH